MADTDCPKCGGENTVRYIQDVTESHTFTLVEDDDSFVDLIALTDSTPHDGFHLQCESCQETWGTIEGFRQAKKAK